MSLAFVQTKPQPSPRVRGRRWFGAPPCDPNEWDCASDATLRKPKRKASRSPLSLLPWTSSTASGSGSAAGGGPSGLPRRFKFLLKFMFLVSAAYLGMAVVQQELGKRQDPPVETYHHYYPSQGIMFFAYGEDAATAEHYLEQAVVSARRIKSLNPSTNITIVANPGVTPDMEGAFDVVINVDKQSLYSGKVQSWGPKSISRQWLTRLEYLASSPYNVTLALDSQALCCSSGVDEILTQSWEEFDISFATQGPRMMGSHNWAILYRLNDRTRRLFERWRTLQLAYARSGTDQLPLHMAAGSLALQDKINVGVLSQNVALATVINNRTGPGFPKSSTLIGPAPVTFVHYDAQSKEDGDTTCEKLNREPGRARVVLLPRPLPKDKETQLRTENIYKMAYSEEELGAAAHAVREDAEYFRGLDWENALGKWGQVATPWRDHYPGCWEDLAKEVNIGVRHVYHDPKHIWTDTHFAAEFANDNLKWPEQ